MVLKQSYQKVHRVALKVENQKSYGQIEVVSFTIKHLSLYLKNMRQALKALFIERFKRIILHIINKPMVINGDGNWVKTLNDSVVTNNNNIPSAINMTTVDASINPDKVKNTFSFKNIKPKHKVGDYVRNADKRNIFAKGYTSIWNREMFKVNGVLKTQTPTYKLEDINGEITEVKYHEQDLLKSEFDFESNNKVLESLNVDLRSATKKIREPASQIDS